MIAIPKATWLGKAEIGGVPTSEEECSGVVITAVMEPVLESQELLNILREILDEAAALYHDERSPANAVAKLRIAALRYYSSNELLIRTILQQESEAPGEDANTYRFLRRGFDDVLANSMAKNTKSEYFLHYDSCEMGWRVAQFSVDSTRSIVYSRGSFASPTQCTSWFANSKPINLQVVPFRGYMCVYSKNSIDNDEILGLYIQDLSVPIRKRHGEHPVYSRVRPLESNEINEIKKLTKKNPFRGTPLSFLRKPVDPNWVGII